jgi:hypothetical protein
MAIATRPPEIPVLEPGRAQPKRRWPKLLALTVVVILLVVAAGWFVWLDHYEPLTLGSGVYGVTPGSQVVASFDAYGPDVDFRQSAVGRGTHDPHAVPRLE